MFVLVSMQDWNWKGLYDQGMKWLTKNHGKKGLTEDQEKGPLTDGKKKMWLEHN